MQVVHARIAMLAAVGWVVQERWHPLFGGDIEGTSVWLAENPLRLLVADHGLAWRCAGPAVSHFQQVPAPFWQLLTLAVGVAEAARARKGWEEPTVAQSWFKLRRSYTPGAWLRRCCAPAGTGANGIGFIWFAVVALCSLSGDLGFDPLRLFPLEAAAQKDMRTRELNNGRLGTPHRRLSVSMRLQRSNAPAWRSDGGCRALRGLRGGVAEQGGRPLAVCVTARAAG
jgi:hypothetical protein